MTASNDSASLLQLVHPTQKEIITQSQHSAASWRGALTDEAYLRREAYLADQSLAKDAGQTYWALVRTGSFSSPSAQRDVLAGCETLKKKAILWQNGSLRDVICHGVASVFTPPKFRGNGYAGKMISQLGVALQDWQAEAGKDVIFSVLYSDIGKRFYAKHGWQACPSSHIRMPPVVELGSSSTHADEEVSMLYQDQLKELCDLDEELVRSRLSRLPSDKTAVALLPDIATIVWHHAREDFIANELYGKAPEIKGAITHVGLSRVWMIWARTWYNSDLKSVKDNVMHVLRLGVERASDASPAIDETAEIAAIARLLRAAQQEAGKWNMEFVELWNPTRISLLAAQKIDSKTAEVHRDTESITSLRWYGEPTDGNVIWMENEKFGWC